MGISLQKPVVLGSASPRRRELLKQAAIPFSIEPTNVDETYPSHFQTTAIPVHLAEKKARFFKDVVGDRLILTADTIVTMDDQVLGKPKDDNEAKTYLQALSGRTHTVITGVCMLTATGQESFYKTTEVTFRSLTASEISYYVANYQPLDKAGAYGIQEWIGLIGVERINGSYWNVIGLPLEAIIQRLKTLGGLTMNQPLP